jgi:MFS family permease
LFLVLKETHLPTLIDRHSAFSNQKRHLLDRLWPFKNHRHDISVSEKLSKALLLPAHLTFNHWPVSLILIFMLIFNGIVNMVLSSLGSVYQGNYHFPPTTAGLAYLGIGLGGVLALWSASRIADWVGRKQAGDGSAKRPEHSLPMMLITGPLFAIGLLWYGWSCQTRAFWFVPIPGLCLFGYGYMATRVSYIASH